MYVPYGTVLLLLLTPYEPNPPTQMDDITWQCFKDVSELLELWDRDGRWINDFGQEFNWMWRERRNSVGLPSLWNWSRFPDRDYCLACEHLAYEWEKHLAMNLMARGHYLPDWSEYCPQWYHRKVWRAACRCTDPNDSRLSRRQAMQQVREMIGEEAWWAGRLPPWAPVEMFKPIP